MAPNGKPQVLDLGWYRTFYTILLIEARGTSVDARDWAEPKEEIRCADLDHAMAALRQLMA